MHLSTFETAIVLFHAIGSGIDIRASASAPGSVAPDALRW